MDENEIDLFIDKLAKEIVARHLAAPAIVILESSKPMSFVGSQLLVFFNPIVHLFVSFKDYETFTKLLEDRNNIEKLIIAIEERENEQILKKKKEKSNAN